jgi:hypothetical protein
MKINSILFSTIFIVINCKKGEDNSIIRIPNKNGSFPNITTKHGLINYEFSHGNIVLRTNNFYDDVTPYIFYKIAGMKNLDLLTLPKNNGLNRFTKNKDKLDIMYEFQQKDRHNPFLCEIFYNTKYIDKKIYSIGKDENGSPYKFFGGTPKSVIKNLNKLTLNNKTNKVTEIKIEFNNNTNYIINLVKNISVDIKEDFYSGICLPENILSEFKVLFLNQYNEFKYDYEIFRSYYIYKLNEEQKSNFPNIKIKIGNKNFIFNKDNIINFLDNNYEDKNYLFINKVSCDNLTFGLKVLELFEVSEFNLESDIKNLYLNKTSNLIETKDNKITFVILLIYFVLFVLVLSANIYYINKNKEYYYNYSYYNSV